MRRLLPLVLAAAIATLAPASALRAQATPTPTQQVPITIKVPFTLQHLYPSVTEIEFTCWLFFKGDEEGFTAILPGLPAPRISIAQLPKAADGSVSGEAIATGTVAVPTTAAGKGGLYRCLPSGCVNGNCLKFVQGSSGGPEYLLTSTSGKVAEGTFTW